MRDIRSITRDELKRKMDGDDELVLLEALPREEFAKGHLPDAEHLPPDGVRTTAPQLIPNETTPVVVYCAGPRCDASRKSAEVLRKMGYEEVMHYEGGKAEWQRAGYRLEQSEAATA